jgi:hypothetical protein
MTDNHVYRRYTCNIEAPYIKCKQIIQVNPVTPVIISYEGSDDVLQTVHTITIADIPLSNLVGFSGEFTVYLRNPFSVKEYIGLCTIQQIIGQTLSISAYKTSGNFTSSSIATTPTEIIITTDPASTLKWRITGT